MIIIKKLVITSKITVASLIKYLLYVFKLLHVTLETLAKCKEFIKVEHHFTLASTGNYGNGK